MPKINRIRIANIQYDKKVIKDLFIDCYKGENVLLNLANGGGKSVLVQLLQQPILPESKIHGREIHSYLSPDQASYILIEWKLDNSPKHYLLTGIVMSKLYSSDDMNKTKYFTFLNDYKSSNEFDIKNILFIQKEENAIIYKSYEAAMQMIRDNRTLENLRLFGRGEQAEYRAKLSEYGIFVNEWKTLAKINENEGGMDEIFKDCKTSDNLINKWILKAISDSNEAESKELKEMFITLMQEIVEKESNIKEKEILENFKEKIKEYQEPLTKLLEQLDKEKKVKETIYEIYLSFQKISKENQDRILQIEEKIMQNEEELKKIEYEEISEEYYHLQSDLEDIKEKREAKQSQFEIQKQIYDKAKFEYRLQEVAHLYQKEKEAIANIDALNIRKRDLQDKNNTDEQLIKIEYNLKEQYSNKIAELNNRIKEIEKENENIKDKIRDYTKIEEDSQKNINNDNVLLGKLKESIRIFEKEEKELFEKLEIFISRNLLNELEEIEVQNIRENFENQIEKLNEEIEKNRFQIEKAENQIKELDKEEEQNYSQIEELKKQEMQKEKIYEEFQNKKEEIKNVLQFHRLEENSIFQKQIYMGIVEEKYLEYKRKVEESVSRIDRLKEYLKDLENGGIHNSREVRKVLEEANIGYMLGEEYLKNQQEEYRKELLENNPLLPYCYIIAQDDLEKIKTLKIEENSNKLAPIITHASLNKKVTKEGQIVQIEQMCFLSLYNKECFSTNTKQYKEKLENQLESYKKRKTEEETELDKIEGHIRILESFDYQEKDEKEMQEELTKLKKKIQDLKEQNKRNKEQIERLNKENKTRNEENAEKQKILINLEQKQEKYLEYLEKNTKYCEGKKQKENCEVNIKIKEENIQKIKMQIDEIKKSENINKVKKKDLENSLKEIEEKNLKIPRIEEEQEKLDNSLEELEVQYEQLTKGYQQDIKQVDTQINIWNKNKQDAQKERQKKYSDIKEDDYMCISYSEDLEDLNKEKSEEEEKILEDRREELNKVNTEYTKIETKFKTNIEKLKNIKKQEAISASQIKGNYEERRNKIKQEKVEGIKKQKEYKIKNDKMQKEINTIERNIDIKDIEDFRKLVEKRR